MQSEHVKILCSSVQPMYKPSTNSTQIQAYTGNNDDDHNNNELQKMQQHQAIK